MAEIVLENVDKSFGDVDVIHDINLKIKDGSFVVFVGPSGCGKSTLLRLIAGLEDISDGQLLIDGELVNNLPPTKRGVAMVFQSYALYPHMKVYDNLAFSLKLAGDSKQQIADKVKKAAEMLELTDLLQRYPKQLSGGQRQRVAIGRAIVRDPKIFLFDEPLSNLDAALRVQMRVELTNLHSKLGTTMIYVTHDQVEAMTMADTIVVLRDGRVEQVGAPLDIYNKPQNKFVAGFIGSPKMNFIDSTIIEDTGDGYSCSIPGETLFTSLAYRTQLKEGAQVIVGIRPEHITVSKIAGGVHATAKIHAIEHLGESQYLYIALDDGQRLVVRTEQDSKYLKEERVSVQFDRMKSHLFSQDGKALQ